MLLEQAYEAMPDFDPAPEDDKFEEIISNLRSVRRMIQRFSVELRPAQREVLLNSVGAIDEEIDELFRHYQSHQD